jgi:acetyl esterase/lipase
MTVADLTLTKKQRLDSLLPERKGEDVLKDIHLLCNAYTRGNAEQKNDPRASPAFANPKSWPDRMFFVTARNDCLYGEQERLVKKIRDDRGGDGGVTWKILEGCDHPSRDARTGDVVEKWDETWKEVAAYLKEVWTWP